MIFQDFLLYKTSLGLTIRSTGENPESVDAAGINVNKVRFLVILLAGILGGLAGAFYSVGYLGMFTNNIINGRGWIHLQSVSLVTGIQRACNWYCNIRINGSIINLYAYLLAGGSYFPIELFIACHIS
ncbi:MAG: hypothetical protein E6600_10725 [Anaerocolumna aminovalerica]|uniref:ABC transporter permease subunit n=1 Tax=Anaerocolumna aminovalerica TaxID=1527 RepID=UPI0020A1522C|nr:hypothetical protein [Anaerocolumna aminovalerica]MDU6264962.1 hypothetical protein [Anaerocolumna aminovalerica]